MWQRESRASKNDTNIEYVKYKTVTNFEYTKNVKIPKGRDKEITDQRESCIFIMILRFKNARRCTNDANVPHKLFYSFLLI